MANGTINKSRNNGAAPATASEVLESSGPVVLDIPAEVPNAPTGAIETDAASSVVNQTEVTEDTRTSEQKAIDGLFHAAVSSVFDTMRLEVIRDANRYKKSLYYWAQDEVAGLRETEHNEPTFAVPTETLRANLEDVNESIIQAAKSGAYNLLPSLSQNAKELEERIEAQARQENKVSYARSVWDSGLDTSKAVQEVLALRLSDLKGVAEQFLSSEQRAKLTAIEADRESIRKEHGGREVISKPTARGAKHFARKSKDAGAKDADDDKADDAPTNETANDAPKED